MPILHINVSDKTATYSRRDGRIVCGNDDYKIQFTFDSDWEGVTDKVARVIVNGVYNDIPITTNGTAVLPEITNAESCEVGVYSRKTAKRTTTSVVIDCEPSILCKSATENPGADDLQISQAIEAAARAEDAAERAEDAAASAEESAEKAATLSGIPTALPNPHPLIINGQTYDGSRQVSVTVEGGGSGGGAQAMVVHIDTMEATATYKAAEIYMQVLTGAIVVAEVSESPFFGDGVRYDYRGANFSGNVCTSVEFVHTETLSDGKTYTETFRVDTSGNVDGWVYETEAGGGSGSGENGVTPHIGENKHWFIGDEDTGVNAEGAHPTGLYEMGGDATKTTYRLEFSDGTGYDFDVYHGKDGKDGKDADPYTLTEDDKALIVSQVIESLGGNPIFGYVDEDNNIIVQGNLADGTYSVKYEMDDGSTVDIGNLVLDTNVYYSITKNLTNCVIDNNATQVVAGGSYSATVTANSGYTLDSVSVTMGGSAVSVTNGVINIESVTGNIVITAVAEEAVEPTNLAGTISIGRLSGSTGSIVTDSPSSRVTDFVYVQKGDIVVAYGADFADTSKNNGVGAYNASKVKVTVQNYDQGDTANYTVGELTSNSGTITVTTDDISYVRISLIPTGTDDDIKVNIKRNGAWL